MTISVRPVDLKMKLRLRDGIAVQTLHGNYAATLYLLRDTVSCELHVSMQNRRRKGARGRTGSNYLAKRTKLLGPSGCSEDAIGTVLPKSPKSTSRPDGLRIALNPRRKRHYCLEEEWQGTSVQICRLSLRKKDANQLSFI